MLVKEKIQDVEVEEDSEVKKEITKKRIRFTIPQQGLCTIVDNNDNARGVSIHYNKGDKEFPYVIDRDTLDNHFKIWTYAGLNEAGEELYIPSIDLTLLRKAGEYAEEISKHGTVASFKIYAKDMIEETHNCKSGLIKKFIYQFTED